MVELVPDMLMHIAPAVKVVQYEAYERFASLVNEMNKQFQGAGIDTAPELCHFIAQAAHETDSFNSFEEYASGKEYEGRKDLGNTVPGYGVKYKGRGIFMTTGYINYLSLTNRCPQPGVSFVENPELLGKPIWAVWSALVYWNDRHLSDIANKKDSELVYSKTLDKSLTPLEYITWRINGGFNGIDSRRLFYERAKQIFYA